MAGGPAASSPLGWERVLRRRASWVISSVGIFQRQKLNFEVYVFAWQDLPGLVMLEPSGKGQGPSGPKAQAEYSLTSPPLGKRGLPVRVLLDRRPVWMEGEDGVPSTANSSSPALKAALQLLHSNLSSMR